MLFHHMLNFYLSATTGIVLLMQYSLGLIFLELKGQSLHRLHFFSLFICLRLYVVASRTSLGLNIVTMIVQPTSYAGRVADVHEYNTFSVQDRSS